ncbi:murein hydrolase activator EnvC [uncultured Pseudokineococcus sp.]|uniref:murein hydrolase activator EnvC family protein n=1 Tax=uncultured Pseudokineococcus sp. TaxID=1642928 RepID=UPI00261DB742|nr:M23 family metallopeptidase [uncultured Pseudokineococcus sp.]
MSLPPASALVRPRCLLRPAVAALGLALAVSFVPGGGPATAAPGDGAKADKQAVDQALHALQEDLVGTSEELTSAYAEYAAVQEQLPGAQKAADLARQVQAEAQAQADDLAQRLSASQKAQTAAEESVRETEQAMTASRSNLGNIAASAYRSNGVPKGLALAMGSADPDDFASSTAAVSSLSTAEKDVLAALSSDEAVRQSATTRLTAVRQQVADLKAEAEQKLAVATEAAEAAAQRQAEVETLIARQQQAVATIESRQAEEQARMDQLQAESDSLGAQLRAIAEEERAQEEARRAAEAAAAQASGRSAPSAVSRGTFRDTGGTFLRPAGTISSPFGMRMHPIKHYMKLHSGQDFAAGCGTPVRAAADGEIVSAGSNGSYGNITVINHGIVRGQPVATAYAHMQSFAVTSGSVTRGQVIGYEGSTGGSTGCHVHFEVRVDGAPTDPMAWI